jgi:hypothetical protein
MIELRNSETTGNRKTSVMGYAAGRISSRLNGSTSKFGWLQASATKNYSAQMSSESPATIRIDTINVASLDCQTRNDALRNKRFSRAMRLYRTEREVRFASTHAGGSTHSQEARVSAAPRKLYPRRLSSQRLLATRKPRLLPRSVISPTPRDAERRFQRLILVPTSATHHPL